MTLVDIAQFATIGAFLWVILGKYVKVARWRERTDLRLDSLEGKKK